MRVIENNNIREVSMDNIKDEEMLNYIDGDIAMADDIKELPYDENNTIKCWGFPNVSSNSCFTTASIFGTRHSISAKIRLCIWTRIAGKSSDIIMS